MSTRYGPSIVQQGLVLCLDAANPKSYTSGAASWNDLTQTQNGAIGAAISPVSLYGGTLSGVGGGNSLSKVVVTNQTYQMSSGDFTYSCWCQPNPNIAMVMFEGRNGAGTTYGTLWYMNTNGAQTLWLMDRGTNGSPAFTQNNGIAQFGGQMTNLVASVSRTTNTLTFYQNGTLRDSQSISSVTGSLSYNGALSTNAVMFDDGGASWAGLMSTFYIYSGVALSPAQVAQNYQALKGRFGQ